MFVPRLSGYAGKDIKDLSLEEIIEEAIEEASKEIMNSGKSGLKKAITMAVAAGISWQEAQE